MRKKYPIAVYVIVVLIAIGILYSLIRNPKSFLIPVIIFGAVFLLYKFPPARLRRLFSSGSAYARTKPQRKAKPAKKRVHLRVIEGTKRSSNDEDEPPRYH